MLALVVMLGSAGLFYGAQPTSFTITRSRTIAAPPPRVMAQLADLRAYDAWDPWPASPGATPTVTYSAVPVGVGAWIDRRDAEGGARTTILSITGDRIVYSNETSGALGGNVSTQSFTLRASGASTEVVWTFGAPLRGLARLLWPFVHVDRRLAPEMDAALVRLDRAATL